MSKSQPAPLLGRLAVHLKMVTMEQLAGALRTHGNGGGGRPLGETLVHEGLIDQKQLAKLLAAQQQVLAKHRANQDSVPTGKPPAAPVQASPEPAAAPTRSAAASTKSAAPPRPAPEAPAAPVAEAPAVAKSAASQPTAPVAESRPPAAPPAKPATSRPAPAADTEAEGPTPIGCASDFAVPDAADRERFLGLLRDALARGASDIHLHPGTEPRVRIGGQLETLADAALAQADVERMVLSALTPEQRDTLAQRGELDVCHTFEGIGRFRANLYREQRGIDGVMRYISATPPTLADLNLPPELARFTTYHQGMVVVTGPSGCGKSSTMAALVNLVNEERAEHILTIEDPIEYVHPSKRCLVNQRSAGKHTESFARALRAALREDPDVIVIGELRDLETVSLALSAAETGHFVLATLHTDNAIRTVNRLIGSFPADQQDQVRTMLSESLRAVISQRLLPRADGQGRVPALETMVVTRAISNLIRENKTFQIHSILQTGASQGMALLDHSISELVKSGQVSAEDAARFVQDAKSLAA